MAAEYKNILIVGATGPLLGQKMVQSFLDKKIFEVFILASPEALKNEAKGKIFQDFVSKGAKVVEAALDDPAALEKALKGIDVIISLLAGAVTVSGQLALLDAAIKAGVKRFIPSDYGFDLSKVKKGEFDYYDEKIGIQEAVQKSGLEYTFIATNVFAEGLYAIFNGFDAKNHKVDVWAPLDLQLSTTYSDDIAKLVPDVLLHPASKNARVQLASHTATFAEIIAAFEKATGHTFERVEVPEEAILEKYNNAKGIMRAVPFSQMLFRRGDATFLNPFNKIHPELAKIETISVEDLVQKLVNSDSQPFAK